MERINLLTDTLPALALGLESGTPDVLDHPPPPLLDNLFARGTGGSMLRDGSLIGALSSVTFLAGGPDTAFGTLVGGQLGYAVLQSQKGLSFDEDGRRLLLGVGGGVLLQLAALTVPPLRRALGLTMPVALPLAGLAMGFASPLLVSKLLKRGDRQAPTDIPPPEQRH